MKIKIIDLLNKIANDEEVPKKIKYNNETFTIREEKDDYANQNYWFTDRFCLLDLNDEIEVIEDTSKKIEKWGECVLEEMRNFTDYTLEDLKEYIRILAKTQNELIDAVNELKRDK